MSTFFLCETFASQPAQLNGWLSKIPRRKCGKCVSPCRYAVTPCRYAGENLNVVFIPSAKQIELTMLTLEELIDELKFWSTEEKEQVEGIE